MVVKFVERIFLNTLYSIKIAFVRRTFLFATETEQECSFVRENHFILSIKEYFSKNMNRIDKVFSKKDKILSIYFTAGYPKLENTEEVILALEASGADLIEVGMPFSDSLVDGETIQESNKIALQNGMTLALLFEQIAVLRPKTELPLVFMGYVNQALQYGFEKFCMKCAEVGFDALIIPDIPLVVYQREYKAIIEKYNLYPIFLITPQTSQERIQTLDKESKGFLYAVSSASTTGAKTGINADQEKYFESLKDMKLRNPILIGFGISDQKTFQTACSYSKGAIIGSAFIKNLNPQDLQNSVHSFVKKIKG